MHATEVGWGYSWDDGSFDTWIAYPDALIAGRDEDGLISLVLTAPTDEGQVFYRSRVTLGDDGVLRPYAEDVAADGDAEQRQSSLSAMAVAPDGRAAFDLVSTQVAPAESRGTPTVQVGKDCPAGQICALGATVDSVDSARTDQPAYSASVSASNAQTSASGRTFDPDVWCGGHHWFLKKSKDVIGRNVTVADQATGAHTTGTFEYKTSKNTSLEIGVTNRAGALVTTLGMTKGSTTATIKGTIPKNTRAEWYVSYGFNLYDVMCPNRTTGVKWWSGYTETRAKGFTGNANRRLWTPFACNSAYRNTIGSNMEISVAKDRTSTVNGSFGVGSSTSANLKLTRRRRRAGGSGRRRRRPVDPGQAARRPAARRAAGRHELRGTARADPGKLCGAALGLAGAAQLNRRRHRPGRGDPRRQPAAPRALGGPVHLGRGPGRPARHRGGQRISTSAAGRLEDSPSARGRRLHHRAAAGDGSVEVLYEFPVPEKTSTITGITVRYHSAGIAYRKTFGVTITICAPADPRPCNRLKESA